MNIFKHLITVMLLTATVVAQASGSGVYRTAITLTNGTQEIFPDTLVKEFRYSHTVVDDRIVYSFNVMKDGHVVMSIPVDSIVEVNYREMTPYEHFAGDWYLVASPNGEPLPGTSIMVCARRRFFGSIDFIRFFFRKDAISALTRSCRPPSIYPVQAALTQIVSGKGLAVIILQLPVNPHLCQWRWSPLCFRFAM